MPDDVANGFDGVQEPHEGGVGPPEINIIRMPGGDAECRIHRKRNNGPNGPHCPVWPIPVQHSASPPGMLRLFHELQRLKDSAQLFYMKENERTVIIGYCYTIGMS